MHCFTFINEYSREVLHTYSEVTEVLDTALHTEANNEHGYGHLALTFRILHQSQHFHTKDSFYSGFLLLDVYFHTEYSTVSFNITSSFEPAHITSLKSTLEMSIKTCYNFMKLQCSPITHWHVPSNSPSPIFNISFLKTNVDIYTLCSPTTAVLLSISYVTNQTLHSAGSGLV